MRIMLDTNILISAIVFDGKILRLLNDLFENEEVEIFVSEYVEDEFRKNLNKNWAARAFIFFEKF